MALTILVVDDSPLIRAVLAKSLRLSGLDLAAVHQAGHGGEALTILEQEPVDLLLTDIHMPEVDGMALLKNLSDTGRLTSLPVLVISSDRSHERREELQALGVDHFLTKPFSPDAVRAGVEEALGAGA